MRFTLHPSRGGRAASALRSPFGPLWLVGGWLCWASCTPSPPNGGGDAGPGTPEPTPQELRACVLQNLPPPPASAEAEWRVSGYVLVETYMTCHGKPEQATSAGFRAVVEEIAQMEADSAQVLITASRRVAP